MTFHHFRHQLKHYYTLDNIVLTLAVLIALGWIWGTMESLQNNFRLQAQVNNLKAQVDSDNLVAQNLELENQYYASSEYQELEARQRLGKAAPGEHMLLLPPNTTADSSAQATKTVQDRGVAPGNFQAWVNFFFWGEG